MRTMQSVCRAQKPWLECQHWLFAPRPESHHVLVSNTDTHTPLSETIGSTGGAKTDVQKLVLWLSWQLCLQGQRGGNDDSTSLLNPCLSRRLREFCFLTPPLDFPSLYHSAASSCIVLWIQLLRTHYVHSSRCLGSVREQNKDSCPWRTFSLRDRKDRQCF